ncbi:hypothetical protein NC652_001496 [Populus alba x Populus x berolinensis]|nr:hypothetical protein NC652_001496 [Populus alba x Populus x berolinensis]
MLKLIAEIIFPIILFPLWHYPKQCQACMDLKECQRITPSGFSPVPSLWCPYMGHNSQATKNDKAMVVKAHFIWKNVLLDLKLRSFMTLLVFVFGVFPVLKGVLLIAFISLNELAIDVHDPPELFLISYLHIVYTSNEAQTTANTGMELADRAVGFLLSLTSISIFTYYTFWVIILPFVDSDHFIHHYFLPQEYAILVPVFAGMVLLCFLSVFVGFVMLKSKKKKA